MNFEVRPGQCDFCGQRTSYVALLRNVNFGRPQEACASCLEDAREAIRRQAEENWETGGPPIDLDGKAVLS